MCKELVTSTRITISMNRPLPNNYKSLVCKPNGPLVFVELVCISIVEAPLLFSTFSDILILHHFLESIVWIFEGVGHFSFFYCQSLHFLQKIWVSLGSGFSPVHMDWKVSSLRSKFIYRNPRLKIRHLISQLKKKKKKKKDNVSKRNVYVKWEAKSKSTTKVSLAEQEKNKLA